VFLFCFIATDHQKNKKKKKEMACYMQAWRRQIDDAYETAKSTWSTDEDPSVGVSRFHVKIRVIKTEISRSNSEHNSLFIALVSSLYDRVAESIPSSTSSNLLMSLFVDTHGYTSLVKYNRLDIVLRLGRSAQETMLSTVVGRELLRVACRYNRLDMMKWICMGNLRYRHIDIETLRMCACTAAEGNAHDVLDWILTRDFTQRRRKRGMSASEQRSMELVHLWSDVVVAAAAVGNLDIIQKINEKNSSVFTTRVAITAARGGFVEVIEWLLQNHPGTVVMQDIIQVAVVFNRINMVQWIVDVVMPRDYVFAIHVNRSIVDLFMLAIERQHGQLALWIRDRFGIPMYHSLEGQIINAGLHDLFKPYFA
jgi:hypothetical protein